MSGRAARLAVLCVFVLGCACGAAAMHLYRLRLERTLMAGEAPLANVLLIQLDRELDLTAEQEARVRAEVMQIRAETLSEMRADVAPRILRIMELGRARIVPLLEDEQREKFERIYRERRAILERTGP